MSDSPLRGDSAQAEYEAKRLATVMNLRRYYNECVLVMANHDSGAITEEEAMEAMAEIDFHFAQTIVDDISPKRSILELK